MAFLLFGDAADDLWIFFLFLQWLVNDHIQRYKAQLYRVNQTSLFDGSREPDINDTRFLFKSMTFFG